jgi:hypothetical protein
VARGPSNPLTARVTVARLWQCIGTGIVKTVEDFGSWGQAWQSARRLWPTEFHAH